MVGKNGIAKLIMKKVIPLLNSELDRLLSDSANFKLNVEFNSKQEVDFMLEKEDENGQTITYLLTEGSGFEKVISSLILRVVLSRISFLPKSNLLVLDEVFGKVANENLDKIQTVIEKISEFYDNIFLITHNEIVQNWYDNNIVIIKENNISRVGVK